MNFLERNWFSGESFPRLKASRKKNYTLKNYQGRVRSFMEDHDRLLIVHGTGTGKTLSSVHIAKDYIHGNPNNFVIFITPDAVSKQFRKSASTVMPRESRVYFTTYPKLRLFLKSMHADRRETFKKIMEHTMVIADEAHYITQQIADIFYNVLNDADKMVLMTATPIVNGELKNLIPYANLLNRRKDVTVKNLEKNTKTTNANQVYKKLKDLFKCKISIVFDKTNFPTQEPTRDIKIPLTREQAEKMEEEYRRAHVSLERHIVSQTEHISWAFDRRIFTEKIFPIVGQDPKHRIFYKLYKNNPMKTIVFFQEYTTLDKFKKFLEKMKLPSTEISGRTSNKSKILSQNTPVSNRIYLLTPSAKEGLDFKGVRRVIFMDLPWTATDYNQIVGRAIRTGSHKNVNQNKRSVKVINMIYTYPQFKRGSRMKKLYQALSRKKSKQTILNRPFKMTLDEACLMNIKVKQIMTDNFMNQLKNVSIERMQCPAITRTIPPNPIPSPVTRRTLTAPLQRTVVVSRRNIYTKDPVTGATYSIKKFNQPYVPLPNAPLTKEQKIETKRMKTEAIQWRKLWENWRPKSMKLFNAPKGKKSSSSGVLGLRTPVVVPRRPRTPRTRRP